MATHYPKVDYSLRPAKAAVRRMIVTALARLNPLVPLESYRYIGMGSIYFRDFQIVHRELGIADMISIEGDSKAEDRIRFNLPLACIDLRMGSTGEILPRLDLDEKPHIIWLDYESRADQDVFADIDAIVGNCAPGSILIITVNADYIRDDDQRESWLSVLGNDRPEPYDPSTRKEYALLSYRAIRGQIDNALDARNAGVLSPDHRIDFHQTFHLVYADGMQMLTVGGGFVTESDQMKWTACDIEALEFVQTGEQNFGITVPRLTRREIHRLLSEMPNSQGDIDRIAAEVGIPPKAARDFARIYRYAPLFVEVESW